MLWISVKNVSNGVNGLIFRSHTRYIIHIYGYSESSSLDKSANKWCNGCFEVSFRIRLIFISHLLIHNRRSTNILCRREKGTDGPSKAIVDI